MQTTIDTEQAIKRPGQPYLFPLLIGGLTLLFFAAPWSWEHKAHAALHGLCAQTPSHTLYLGDRPLPFDSRMTGIYGGFICAIGYLIARGKHRAARLPTFPVMGFLAVMVGALAIDGFNSFLRDISQPYLYEPDNRLRLVTGLGTGVALATVVCYLFAVTLWSKPNTRARVINGRELPLLIVAQLPFALLALSGWGWLSLPMTLLLLLSALAVISSLALVAIVLFRRLDYSFAGASELQQTASLAVMLAVILMASLAGGRFLLEHYTGVQPLP
jgi:uncharacterized membrane protein